jgi:hypothetical protein
MAMRPLFLICAAAVLAACTQPMLSADMAVSNSGVQVYPTLSGVVGNTTISLQPN